VDKPAETVVPDLGKIEDIVARYRDRKWPLIPLLQEIQDEIGYVPPEAIEVIARGTGLFPTQVQGVISFYEQFHMSCSRRAHDIEDSEAKPGC